MVEQESVNGWLRPVPWRSAARYICQYIGRICNCSCRLDKTSHRVKIFEDWAQLEGQSERPKPRDSAGAVELTSRPQW